MKLCMYVYSKVLLHWSFFFALTSNRKSVFYTEAIYNSHKHHDCDDRFIIDYLAYYVPN